MNPPGPPLPQPHAPTGWWAGLQYGALGFPLAFVALPLYVVLPHHYAQHHGLSLSAIGGVFLAARAGDALLDPLLGRWVDRLSGQAGPAFWRVVMVAAMVLALGTLGLFLPPVAPGDAMIVWLLGALWLTYLAYSVLGIAHQSWGARLGQDEAQRSRWMAWREGAGLLGVVVAAALPAVIGLPALWWVLAASLVLGVAAWHWGPQAPRGVATAGTAGDLWAPWRRVDFRRLVGVYALNGVASAIPATLVLFFIQDRLQAPAHYQGYYLGGYFVAAAAGMPAWLRAVRAWGLARTWCAGMALSVLAFVWAMGLGAGDTLAFGVICALSGLALGADLALPSALLAGLVHSAGAGGQREGVYFGWWNLVTKSNLALAAGVALPLLALWGYQPGTTAAAGLQALTWAYAGLPCALKLGAAAWLYTSWIRIPRPQAATTLGKDLA